MSNITSQLGETTSEDPQSTESATDQSSVAWKIFNAFIDGSEISATEEELREYVENNLKIDLTGLPPVFIENVPLILVAYMNNWTGWIYKKEFLDGKFQKQHYFTRFNKHLAHKMKAIGNTTFLNKALKTLPRSVLEFKCKRTVKLPGLPTGTVMVKRSPEFSPFAISIQCPPHMLNTIVFSNVGDDVIMKQHVGNYWKCLSTAQLLNWPNVEVSFGTQDICFVRRQATEYVRYLNFLPHECKNSNEHIIESVETINSDTYGQVKSCYTYRFLEEYIKEYISSLKTINDITGLKLEEIQTVLLQFLEDVRHINIKNSIATNTVVLFRLSKVPFIRNKKLVKNTDKEGEDARVGYCEIITPKVELVLLYFKAQQKDTPYISFEFTDKIKKANASTDLKTVLPYIAYKCTFCRIEFNSGNTKTQMMDHLQKEHKMEQHVRCTVCKKQFDVLNLAACRWRHKCIISTSTFTVS